MQYRREIDGLRAIAVIPVILFHAGFETFRGGFVGVDIFFVISGYLITSTILAQLEQGKFSISEFYERRARRIFPALFFVMLCCIPLAWLWLLPSDMKDFSQSLVAVSVFASNALFWRESGYFDTASELKPLLHTWSLAVEEQYYFIFPLFLCFFWRFGKRRILGALGLVFIASLGIAEWAAYAKPLAAYYLLPTRVWELLVGAFAAFYLSRNYCDALSRPFSEAAGWLGVGLIQYSIYAFSNGTPFPGLYALVPTLGALLIIIFATSRTIVGRILGTQVFVGIGLISYSAYLWHQPLFAFARHRSLTELSSGGYFSLSVIALVLAYFSWRYVELPFRRKQNYDNKKFFTISLFALFGILFFGLYGHFSGGVKWRFDDRIIHFFTVAQYSAELRDDGGCNLHKDLINPKFCVKGDENAPPSILLVGDSHAAALAGALSSVLKGSGKSFLQLTKNACPFGRGITDGRVGNCSSFNEVLIPYLESKQYDTVVVAARWSWYLGDDEYDNGEGGVEARRGFSYTAANIPASASVRERSAAILQSYSSSISDLLSSGKKVILVYPVPEQGWNVPSRAARLSLISQQKLTGFGIKSEEYFRRNDRVISVFDSLDVDSRLFRVKPSDVFCNTMIYMRCVAYAGGVIYYYDEDHLTDDGAMLLVGEIQKLLR